MSTGVITRPEITGFSQNNLTSVSPSLRVECNFDSNKIAVSDEKVGKVKVYSYSDFTTPPWTLDAELTSGFPTSSNGFGISMSMDWDGERIVVGANVISNVYTFDYVNGAWNTTPRIIEGNPNSEFGFSVSIAKNDFTLICVGAPRENKVYVYKEIQGAWNQVFYNDGSDIISRVPYDYTKHIIFKSEYNFYGYHVHISNDGEYVIAGAPGDTMGFLIDIDKIEYMEVDATGVQEDITNYSSEFPFPYDSTAFFRVPHGELRHLGSVRVLYINGEEWKQGVSGPLGNDIKQSRGVHQLKFDSLGGQDRFRGTFPLILDPSDPAYWEKTDGWVNTVGWSLPAFGSCVHVQVQGGVPVITVGAPGYSNDSDYGYFSGRILKYIYSDEIQDWISYGTDLVSPNTNGFFGLNFKYDYSGKRIAIGYNGSYNGGRLHVFELLGDSWIETQPSINIDAAEMAVAETNDDKEFFSVVNVSITNGKHVFCTSSKFGIVHTRDFSLTQVVVGNNIFSGFISSDIFRVGGNSGADTSLNKIAFGGTFNDQSYDNTVIENRALPAVGRSELLCFKTSSDVNQPDIIRLKSAEMHLDNFINTEYYYRTTGGVVDQKESKEFHVPTLVINYKGDMCIHPHVQQTLEKMGVVRVGRPSNYATDRRHESCEGKAKLDINCDVFLRNRLNVNSYDKNNVRGLRATEPFIFYDTRDPEIVFPFYEDSNTLLVKSVTRPVGTGTVALHNINGLIAGDVQLSDEHRGFIFTGNGKIENQFNWTGNHQVLRISFWIKLLNDQSTYTTSDLVSIVSTKSDGVTITIQLNTTGIKFLHTMNNNPSSVFSFDSTFNFDSNKWYNVQMQTPGGITVVPQHTSEQQPSGLEDKSFTALWINTIKQPLTLNGTAFANNINTPSYFNVGGNTENIVLGLIGFWNGAAWTSTIYKPPSGADIFLFEKTEAIKSVYDYGHPTEMLVVDGDTNMSGKLGIGITNPTEALEVSGNVHANYFVGDGSRLTNLQGPGLGANTLQEVTDEGSSTSQTIYLTNTGTSLETSGKVGVGTTTPSAPLQVAASGSASNPSTNGLYVYNPTNSSGEDSCVSVRVGGSNAGDPFISFDVAGDAGWAWGMDNSDGNKMKLSSDWSSVSSATKMTIDTNGNVTIPGYYTGAAGTVIQEGRENVTTIAAYYSGGTFDIQISALDMTVTKRNQNSAIALNYVVNCEANENNVFKIYRNGLLITGLGFNLYGVTSAAYDADYNSTIENVVIDFVDYPPSPGVYTYTVRIVGNGSYFYLNRTANTADADVLGGYRENTISTKGYKEICT